MKCIDRSSIGREGRNGVCEDVEVLCGEAGSSWVPGQVRKLEEGVWTR